MPASPDGGSKHRPVPPHVTAGPVHETVDPIWLLGAGLGLIGFAVLCAYLTVCIVFARTQWQLVLQPSRSLYRTPAALRLPFEEVRFGPGPDGQPQLDGWWIPAEDRRAPLALLLHGGAGNMADAVPLAQLLHNTGLQVFLFDYRGFGRSSGAHPAQASMQSDVEDALAYLKASHGGTGSAILPVGEGIGASLAVHLAASHPDLPAVILYSPDGDLGARAAQAPRSHLVPFSLLFHEAFPLTAPLASLRTPKLILSPGRDARTGSARGAADPKMTIELPAGDESAFGSGLRRFLDNYVPRPPQQLTPLPNASR